jgi:uncharacterized protein (UPF0254 family)
LENQQTIKTLTTNYKEEKRSSIILAAVAVPSVNGKWKVKEIPTPKPSANQVLIKIHASDIAIPMYI